MKTNEQYQRSIDRKRTPWENVFHKLFKKDLIQKGKQAAAQIVGTDFGTIVFDDSTTDLIEQCRDEVGFEFLFFGFNDLKSQEIDYETKEFKNLQEELSQAEWERMIQSYMDQFGFAIAVSIDQTTAEAMRQQLRAILEDGFERGLGIPQIQRNMVKSLTGPEWAEFADWRALRIARTEVIGASNWGAWQTQSIPRVAENSYKIWVHSTRPKQDRESHVGEANLSQNAGGQPVDLRYPITGLMFPHEPGAPASQVVNCRCSNRLVVREGQLDQLIAQDLAEI